MVSLKTEKTAQTLLQTRSQLLWIRYLNSLLADDEGHKRAERLLDDSGHSPLLALKDSFISESEEAVIQNDLAWNLLTCPQQNARNSTLAPKLARAALNRTPEDATIWNTLGVAECRCGDFASAERTLRTSVDKQRDKQGTPADLFFLSMAQAKLGRKDEARAR